MISFLIMILYNLVVLPIIYLLLILAMPFNQKIRKGILGRFGLYRKLRSFRQKYPDHRLVVLHSASMGEFEHTKPFLLELKHTNPDLKIVVCFFSPSGFENVKDFSAVDLFLFSPHEFIFSIWRFINIARPSLWIIAKHDVWPNQTWMMHLQKIPLFLINASLHRESDRLLWFTRGFHRAIYQYFTRILTISHTDETNFLMLVDEQKLIMVGDTKYDQVLFRRDESLEMEIIPDHIYSPRWVLVAGSTWPEDQIHILPALIELQQKYSDMLFIICPHEPTPTHLEEIKEEISPLRAILLSDIQNFNDEEFILIDRIGVLANLYSTGKVAYVGGSFKQNIHNVLEAAVYQIPTLFGPMNQNSYEAQLLKTDRGGWEVRNSQDICTLIEKFYLNEVYRLESGMKAYRVVQENCGATARSVEIIQNYLSQK
jgi:3-deoxy-D-manno-octulosonic-acid transferase